MPRLFLGSQCVKLEIAYLTMDRRLSRAVTYRFFGGRVRSFRSWSRSDLEPSCIWTNVDVSFSRVSSVSVETLLLSHARSKAEDRPALFLDFAQTLAVFILRSVHHTCTGNIYLAIRIVQCEPFIPRTMDLEDGENFSKRFYKGIFY